MKKLLALLLTLAMLFSLAACGSGDDEKAPSNNDNTSSSSQQQEQNTPDPDPVESESGNGSEKAASGDWQAIMKTVYGIDLTLPEGWEFSDIRETNGHQFNFSYTGDSFDSDYVALCEMMFELTAEVGGERGNYIYKDGDYPSIDEIPTVGLSVAKTIVPTWHYNFESKSFMLGLGDNSTSLSAYMNFLPDNEAK